MNIKKLANRIFNGNSNYPTGGEVFESLRDTPISYLTHYMAPYTGGDKAIILKGERIIVSKPNKPKPSGYYCYPLNTEEVEKRIIPDSERNDPQYNGFSLYMDTSSIVQNFKQVELMPISNQ